ncbi:hypothetical protein GGF37_000852 [Kickxella alabastrina]|nr:hypothetical protein GGF37_000852 [Kickxella alabastrina]
MSSSAQRKAPWDRSTKYWCQYCQIFVHDNKSSRDMHERGAKHKECVQKYLRKIETDSKEKREAEEKLRSDLDKIERAAMLSYNRDIGNKGEAPKASAADEKPSVSAKDEKKGHAESSEPDVQDKSNQRADDAGIVGAWEVVEEPEPAAEVRPERKAARSGSSVGRRIHLSRYEGTQGVKRSGAGVLDDADGNNPQRLSQFEIKEKTVASGAIKIGNINNDGAEEGPAAMGALFKKRRTAANRTTARKQHKPM